MKDREKNCQPCRKTSIGGQALLEGVMMRGPQRTAMAVRNTSGEIVVEGFENETSKRAKITKLPFVRGIFNFLDSMKLGMKCLMRSAEISGLEELEAEMEREKAEKKRAKKAKKSGIEPEAPVDEAQELKETTENTNDTQTDAETSEKNNEKSGSSALTGGVMAIGTILGVVLAVGLFIYLPTFLSTLVLGQNAATEHPVWLAVISGVIKVAVLVGYMAIIPALMKDIKRTFMYHGAEHKTIFCYEHGNELTVENVKKEKRYHPRCGTSFLFLMVFVSIIFMIPIGLLLTKLPGEITQVKWLYTLIRTGIAILLIPIMTGIGYELIKLAGRKDNILTRIISAPGLWMQRITTREPDDGMIECAITALKEVIPPDESDKW